MLGRLISITAGVLALTLASPDPGWPGNGNGNGNGHHAPFEYFVVFGDSYTDDGLGNYYGLNDDQPPPPGILPNETAVNSGGGLVWPQYIGNYTGATIYDYASGGATCSNNIVARVNTFTGLTIPSVKENQVPKYEEDTKTELFRHVTAENTVYALWIGTNDLGTDCFLTDSQAPGASLVTYVDCIWSIFDAVYTEGGRRFVLLGNNALQLTPSYQVPSKGGTGNSLSCNITETSQKMFEYVQTTNQMMEYGIPFNLVAKKRWPGASFAYFSVYDLIVNIYNNPEQYLDPPYNVTGWYDEDPAVNNLDGFLWFDTLHPTNKTGRQ